MNNTIMDSNMVTEFSMPINDYKKNILNDEAIEFATILQKTFNPRRLEILKARKKRQSEVDSGIMPNFSLKTKILLKRLELIFSSPYPITNHEKC